MKIIIKLLIFLFIPASLFGAITALLDTIDINIYSSLFAVFLVVIVIPIYVSLVGNKAVIMTINRPMVYFLSILSNFFSFSMVYFPYELWDYLFGKSKYIDPTALQVYLSLIIASLIVLFISFIVTYPWLRKKLG